MIPQPDPDPESMTMSLTQIGGSGSFWSVGSELSGGTTLAGSFAIQNGNDWGTGTDTNLTISTGGMHVRLEAGAPGTRTIVIETLHAEIPSFAHSYIAPALTGTNVFTLRQGYYVAGSLNLTTGAVNFTKVPLDLTNNYFTSSSPAHVFVDVAGTANFSTKTLSLSITGNSH
jgi:hypothetical protein